MTVIEEQIMFCTICGAPVYKAGAWAVTEWLTDASLIYPETGDNGSPTKVVAVSAINKGGPFFVIGSTSPGTGTRVIACDDKVNRPFPRSPRPTLYIQLHTVCLEIVKVVASSSTTTTNVSRETLEAEVLSKVWRVLYPRFVSDSKDRRSPTMLLWDPHDYYGIRLFQGLEWVPEGDEHGASKWYEAEPVGGPDMTSTLLDNLQPLPSDSFEFAVTATSSPLPSLPAEIMQSIINHLKPFTEKDQKCTYAMPPPYWKQALLQGTILPWLPKLDPEIVNAKDAQAANDGKAWDWECLVRQLGAIPFRDGPGVIMRADFQVSMGVWNRRRIWQLAEDILTGADEKKMT